MLKTDSFKIFHSGIRKQLLSRKIEVGIVTLSFTLILMTCILSILLLLHSNEVATKGYDLRSLQNQLSSMELRNEKLKSIVAEKKSISSISESYLVRQMLAPINDLVIVKSERRLAQK
jgi:hypothetical protein